MHGEAVIGGDGRGLLWIGEAGIGPLEREEFYVTAKIRDVEIPRMEGLGRVRFELFGYPPGFLMGSPKSMLASAGTRIGVKRIPSADEDAEMRSYRLPSGQLYVPATMVRASMIDACRNLKIGRSSVSKLLSQTIQSPDEFCPLYDPHTLEPIEKYVVHPLRVVQQGQGIIRCRGLVYPWCCTVVIEYDKEIITDEDILGTAITRAGRISGIGDFRPMCPHGHGGPYGRFTVRRIPLE